VKYVELSPNGAARIRVDLATNDGKGMKMAMFLLDTGATRTTINSKILSDLGYDKKWIEINKISL